MCLLKTGTRIFSVLGEPLNMPDFPVLPPEWAIEFEVADSKAGRSAVAKAMNHGNAKLPFAEVREEAYQIGWVARPRYLQGLVFSDSPIDGTERYLLGTTKVAPPEDLFSMADPSGYGHYHVFSLGLGDAVPETAADIATRYAEGQGFLMKSYEGSLIFAIYHEETAETPASWQVYGGGGTVYLHFLEEAVKDARRNGVLLYEA
ncbi:hypothetical protein IJI72_03220 [Candidatus Saccharibacteria bacterium]|nr:hypothetical protein [Candidatus Saccharibacteria bacterium]